MVKPLWFIIGSSGSRADELKNALKPSAIFCSEPWTYSLDVTTEVSTTETSNLSNFKLNCRVILWWLKEVFLDYQEHSASSRWFINQDYRFRSFGRLDDLEEHEDGYSGVYESR